MKKARIWMAVGLIFASGLLTGFIAGLIAARMQVIQTIQRGPDGIQDLVMQKLIRDLQLTESQRASIEPIVTRAHLNLQKIRAHQQPAIQSIVGQAIFEIRPELTDAQNKRLDKMEEAVNLRWKGLSSL